MFVQIIEARVRDRDGLLRQWSAWDEQCRPGAIGFLGSTGGLTDDGRFFTVARFESEEAARQNAERPEQGSWWQETAKVFEGEPSFSNSTEIDQFLDGGSDDAGFVQIMRGRADRAQLQKLLADVEPVLRRERPEIYGGITAWDGDRLTDIVYFRSEAEAREGEKKMAETPGGPGERLADIVSDLEFIDLREPLIR